MQIHKDCPKDELLEEPFAHLQRQLVPSIDFTQEEPSLISPLQFSSRQVPGEKGFSHLVHKHHNKGTNTERVEKIFIKVKNGQTDE